MSSEPKVIYSAANTQQAHLLRGLLEAEGITARVVNDALQIAGGELPLGWTAAARVVVPEGDAVRARQIAEDFDRTTSRGATSRRAVDDGTFLAAAEWPRCPQCGMGRSAQCPICGSVGTDFSPAEFQPLAEGERPLFMCQTCDDHMVPEWYRYCAGCQHDFGSGLAPRPPDPPPAWPNRQVVVVGGVLLVLAVVFVAYFWWLLS